MRAVIIVLVVIVLAFVVVAVYGGARGPGTSGSGRSSTGCGAPPANSSGDVDESSLRNWHPCGVAKWLGSVTSAFAPKLKLDQPEVHLSAHTSATRSVPSYHPWIGPDTRVAHVTLQSGAGALVQYTCPPGTGCSTKPKICVCERDVKFSAAEVSGCPESWRRDHLATDPHAFFTLVCQRESAEASFAIYPQADGSLAFTALGNAPVKITVK